MDLLIHIGAPKCGSSLLQTALMRSRNEMKDCGVLYPLSGLIDVAHHKIPFSIRGESLGFTTTDGPGDFGEYVDKVVDEASSMDCRLVIISSEVFSSFTQDDIRLLAPLTEHFDSVKIVAYVRNQAGIIESTYKFNVLWDTTRESIFFESFLDKHLASDYHSYLSRLEKWRSVGNFGNIVVKDFDVEIRTGFVAAFLNIAQIGGLDALDVADSSVNASLYRVPTIVLRAFNECYPAERNSVIESLRKMQLEGFFSKEERLYTPSNIERISQCFRRSNEALRERFGVDLNSHILAIDKDHCKGESLTGDEICRMFRSMAQNWPEVIRSLPAK